jgi:NADPH-dependent glutamate synthase beta subunit-like oxidoreductase/2,4-dienoyl-CoA reductase-like NADH-dependent reductase (Old Yellow Enzyme family)
MTDFPLLFSPIKLGPLTLKNRIGGSCTTTGGADINGYIQEECLYSYAARSEGGAAFITIECTFATDWGAKTTSFGNPRISGRAYYEGQSNLAEAIKQCGAKAFIQITPSFGRQGSGRLSGETPGAPSAIPSERPQDYEDRIMPRGYETRAQTMGGTTVPKVLTIEEIEYMERTFPDAVAAARICGYDAVEFHSPHGYLIHQFLSPRSNQRNDLYGGSLENRFRFLRNLLIASRRRVGPDFCLGIRLSGDEHMPGSIHEEELIQVAKWCQDLGASYIHLSDGSYEARKWFFPQDSFCFIEHAKHFKKELKIPLIVPGQHDPYLAEEVLRNGWADVITMGRQLVADQQTPRKWEEGRVDEVKRCLRCNVCLARFNRGLAIRCAVNPNIGREKYDPKYSSTTTGNVLRPLPEPFMPPCENTCPAGLDVNAYMLMASRGQFGEAYRRLKVQLPFPGVIGRVCPHPCEAECNRGKQDEPIAINATKRFIADWVMKNGLPDYLKKQALPEKLPITKKHKVAVVGSGPAGLTAAYFLIKKGYAVTVFEAASVAGGMMSLGVPEHRLPRDVVKWEIDAIKKMGVEIKTSSPVGKGGTALDDLKKKGYDAVFMAVGSQNSLKLNVPGEDADGVLQALHFLRDINTGQKVAVGKKVVVIGGGSVAMDVATSARRLGAGSVQVVCLECSNEEMPALEEEILQAEEEGIKVNRSWGPKQILTTGGKVSGIELKRCTACYTKTGRFAPVYDEKDTKKIDADMVITAIGQSPDLSFLPAGSKLKTTRRGTFDVNSRSLATNIAGIFAGGDVARGQGTMIEAIADGKKAAVAIDCYLSGVDLPPEPPEPVLADIEEPAFQFHLREYKKEEREPTVSTPVKNRKGNFKEINLGFADEAACIQEARRCLTCRCSAIRY